MGKEGALLRIVVTGEKVLRGKGVRYFYIAQFYVVATTYVNSLSH